MSILNSFILVYMAITSNPYNTTFACHVERFGGEIDVFKLVATRPQVIDIVDEMKKNPRKGKSPIFKIIQCIELRVEPRFKDERANKLLLEIEE